MQTQVGRLIHEARARKGFTLRQLEELTGINFKAINRIEKGHTARPHSTTLAALAGPLELDLPALLDAIDNGQAPS